MAWRQAKWLKRIIDRQAGAKPKAENKYAPYRNSWEKRVGDYLEAERIAGKWVRVHYERATFAIVPKVGDARSVSYQPDFTLLDDQGRIFFVECKGHMRPGAENKIKALREMFPTVPIYIAWIEAGQVRFVQF